ncbi:pyridoxamine kinase [Dipodascopsis tothii]|uniref:pyridoxamine kinase n=1 Tax=Dipodascopsis tothii TaxID=44089 RepID=UPI0034CD87CE
MSSQLPRVLTIAGSDSSGGAGIEADLKTFTVHGCYGMTCITALTAQNTTGVKGIYPVTDQEFIATTLRAVFDDIGVDAVKTGMLACADTVRTVARCLREYDAKNICVDPVMISTSGSQLLPEDAIDVYLSDLISIAFILTPNIGEAKFIVSKSTGADMNISSLEDAKNLAVELHRLGPKYVLVKGGHLPLSKDGLAVTSDTEDAVVADILYDGEDFVIITSPHIITENTHGTGCTLASSIASNLAKNEEPLLAVKHAIEFVHGAILSDLRLGAGNGPLNHLYRML